MIVYVGEVREGVRGKGKNTDQSLGTVEGLSTIIKS